MNDNNLTKNTAIFLATVLVTGVIGISSSFTIFAQEYDGYEYDDYGYEKEYKEYDDAYHDYDHSSSTQTNNGVIGVYSPFTVFPQEYDGYEYDDYGYEKEYKEYDDAYHDYDHSSSINIIINDQDAIGIGIKPNVQNCAPINIEALLTSGDEGVDCHNQRDQTSGPEQSGTD